MKSTAPAKPPIIVFLSLLLLTVLDDAATQGSLSAGCDLVNQQDGQYQNFLSDPVEFFAGERLIISADEPHSGLFDPSLIILFINGVEVDRSGYPGTLEYTFISGQTATVRWGSDFSSPTWDATCNITVDTVIFEDGFEGEETG